METYAKIIAFLKEKGVSYRELEHEAAGRSEEVAKVRGSQMHQGAKAMVLEGKLNKEERCYFLAILPADYRLDFKAIADYVQAEKVSLASPEKVLELTGCVVGTVPPISFNPGLTVLADPALLDNQELVFNAGRLDCSIFVPANPFLEALSPVMLKISTSS